MQCEGVIPERRVPVGSELVETQPAAYEDRDGEQVLVRPATVESRIVYETTPERPCEAEATMLARSMTQVLCSLDAPHWVKDGTDHAYCSNCFRPGTVTDLAGNASTHAAMPISEYEG